MREGEKPHQEKLQGRWKIVSIAGEGKIFKTEDKPDELKNMDLNDLLIKGDRLEPTRADTFNSCCTATSSWTAPVIRSKSPFTGSDRTAN